MTVSSSISRNPLSAVSASSVVSSLLTVQTPGRGFVDLTAEVAEFVQEANAIEGQLTLFIRHTSASLTIQENADPTVLRDLTAALDRLAPEDFGWSHDTEGPRIGGMSPNGAPQSLSELTGGLMAMIVHPYLGSAAARRELDRPAPQAKGSGSGALKDPFKDLSIRFTYRTARVLATIAANTGASNRLVANTSGIADEGQTSRLLARLQQAELIENRGAGRKKGEANAWALTERGKAVQTALAGRG